MGPKCLRPTCHDGTYRAETVIVEAPLPVAGDPPYPELDATKRFRTNHSPPSTGHDVRPGRTWPQLPGPVQSSVLATVRTTSDWLGNGEYVCALGEMRSVCWASGVTLLWLLPAQFSATAATGAVHTHPTALCLYSILG
jgi:hypothetical protein